MSTGAMFYIQQQLARLTQDCSNAKLRVSRANTMREVKFAAHVITPSVLRGLPDSRRACLELKTHASRKMDALLDTQLAKLAALGSVDEFTKIRGQLARHDWAYLRGAFAATLVRAERESTRILHLKARPSESAPSAPEAGMPDEESTTDRQGSPSA